MGCVITLPSQHQTKYGMCHNSLQEIKLNWEFINSIDLSREVTVYLGVLHLDDNGLGLENVRFRIVPYGTSSINHMQPYEGTKSKRQGMCPLCH